jgi:hypothetical protein
MPTFETLPGSNETEETHRTAGDLGIDAIFTPPPGP